MEKESFLLYTSIYEPIKDLTDEQMGRLFRAILLCNLDEPYEVDTDIMMAFKFIQQQIDFNYKKYLEVVEKRSKAGKKGGAPKGNKNASKKNKTSKTSINENEDVNEHVNVYDDVNGNEYASESIKEIHPPSLEEIENYVCETGLHIDAEHFYSYYESVGWMMSGGRPVVDWKAAVRNWEKHSGDFDPVW